MPKNLKQKLAAAASGAALLTLMAGPAAAQNRRPVPITDQASADRYSPEKQEMIANTHMSWEERIDAVYRLWAISVEIMGLDKSLKESAFAALQRIAKSNSEPIVRTAALGRLSRISQENPEILQTVLDSAKDALQDSSILVKDEAIFTMDAMIETIPELSDEQMATIKSLFEKAAQEPALRDHAAEGLDLIKKRLAVPGHPAPHPYPRR